MSEFIHLHNHSMYSLLDGAIRLNNLAEKVGEYNMDAVALTDHGNMFGAIDFYQTMKQNGIKPIIGCEVYITPGSRHEKNNRKKSAYHLILLAENNTGYTNLVKLVSKAYLEGFYRKPRIDYELLTQYHDGLIALSACLGGEIPAAVLAGEKDTARRIAERYNEIMGKNNFYLEVQQNGMKAQRKVNSALLDISKELSIPLVATNDCHYLNRDDKKAHEVLLCIQTGHTINDPDRLKYESDTLYFRPAEEMVPLFSEFPDAVKNTLRIAERCNVELDLGHPVLPKFQPPEGKSLDDYLTETARKGLEQRLRKMHGSVDEAAYWKRLESELTIIRNMGFSGYFLIVSDFIQFAHSAGIAVGPGRGSGAGSLVAYALKIIDLDPIPYHLLFERFLNPERVSMPDFDIDFCMSRREEVLRYVSEKYGKEKVGQIITFNSMKAKAVIRDVGRALQIPLSEVDKLAKLVPADPKMTLDKAFKQESRLRSIVEKNAKYTELFDIARKLEGLNRHAGVHAAGVVISEHPLWETVPVKREDSGEIVTQFAKDEVEKAGLVKFDFLGLKTLTVIQRAQQIVNSRRPPDTEPLDISSLTVDDPAVYKLISSGETFGVFQMESSGFQEMMRQMQPSCFEDIIAAVALYRPGPMKIIPDFIARKHGQQKIDYPHPSLEPILKDTYGLMVYQEQVMHISRVMAGFSLGYADILRRAMGKKKPKVMEQMRKIFLNGDPEKNIPGAVKLGYDAHLAQQVFDKMQDFAKYGFNKSHAAGYALLSYQTAYLKCHYPREFMAALMSCDRDKTEKVVKAIGICAKMGIEVLPPDVNSSEEDFTVVENGIRFGLAAVKNVGIGAVEAIIDSRKKEGPFRSIYEFCRRVDLHAVNRRVVESLIKCGAFDSMKKYRSQMMAALDKALEIGQKTQRDKEIGQASMFDVFNDSDSTSSNLLEPELPNIPEWSSQDLLAREKESLGFYVTGHPLMRVENQLKMIRTHDSSTLNSIGNSDHVIVCGIVSHVKRYMTKTKEQMAFITLEDLSGFLEVIVRPNLWASSRDLLESDEILVIMGKASQSSESQVKVVAEEIMKLEDARKKLTNSVCITVSNPLNQPDAADRLCTLLGKFRGNIPVHLEILFGLDARLESILMDISGEFKINPSDEFFQALEKLAFFRKLNYR